MKKVQEILAEARPQGQTERLVSELVDAGFLDESKVILAKRALTRNASELTIAERRCLAEMVDSLGSIIVAEAGEYKPRGGHKGYTTDVKIPTVLTLKRRAIRVYPNNQKVALYYSDTLDKYVSIPFGDDDNINAQIDENLGPAIGQIRQSHSSGLNKVAGLAGLAIGLGLRGVVKAPGAVKSTMKQHRYDQYVDSLNKAGSADNSTRPAAVKQMRKSARKANFWGAKDPEGKKLDPVEHLKRIHHWKQAQNRPEAEKREKEMDTKKGIPPPTIAESFLDNLAETRARCLKENMVKQAVQKALAKLQGNKTGAAATGAGAGAAGGAAAAGQSDSKPDTTSKTAGNVDKEEQEKARDARDRRRDTSRSRDDRIDYDQPDGNPFYGMEPQQGRIGQTGRVTRDPVASRELKKTYAESNLTLIKNMVREGVAEQQVPIGQTSVNLNLPVAKKIIRVYESLNKANKKKIEQMLNEDATTFRRAVDFAVRS